MLRFYSICRNVSQNRNLLEQRRHTVVANICVMSTLCSPFKYKSLKNKYLHGVIYHQHLYMSRLLSKILCTGINWIASLNKDIFVEAGYSVYTSATDSQLLQHCYRYISTHMDIIQFQRHPSIYLAGSMQSRKWFLFKRKWRTYIITAWFKSISNKNELQQLIKIIDKLVNIWNKNILAYSA